MPFARPTLSQLISQVQQDVGAGSLLRFSNLNVIAKALAGLANLHYGYIDWIARQASPLTAEGEYLEGWANLKRVQRIGAAQASGSVSFAGTAAIPAGTSLVRGDGVTATVTVPGVPVSGTVTVVATVDSDLLGLTGAYGNCDAGTAFALAQPIAGVQGSSGSAATAFTGGADIETDDSLRTRMLQAYQAPATVGNGSQYETWALAVPGVTRAWAVPKGFGAGTMVVYVMLDVAEAAHGGFPQGSDGVATADAARGAVATGDQLAVANAIYPQQPGTALVYIVSPIAYPVAMTIQGLAAVGSTVQAQVEAAITGVFSQARPGGVVYLRDVEAAINAIPGLPPFVIESPTANVTLPTGSLPTLGAITWA